MDEKKHKMDTTEILIGAVGYLTILLPIGLAIGALPGILVHSDVVTVVGAVIGAVLATAFLLALANSD